ncbi:DUF1758 domain-containing protein, partial [Aphis craccivora]
MSDLNALIAQRGQIKAQLTRFATYLRTNGGDDVDFEQIKQIEEEDSANGDNEKYRDEFENLYFENMAKSEKIFKRADSINTSASPSNVGGNAHICIKNDNTASINPNVNSIVKLAPLEIPQFSGAYTEWA